MSIRTIAPYPAPARSRLSPPPVGQNTQRLNAIRELLGVAEAPDAVLGQIVPGATAPPVPVATEPAPTVPQTEGAPRRSDYLAAVPDYKPAPVFDAPERDTKRENNQTLLGAGIAGILGSIFGRGNAGARAMSGYAAGSRGAQDANYQAAFGQATNAYKAEAAATADFNEGVTRQTKSAEAAFDDSVTLYKERARQQEAEREAAARVEAERLRREPKPSDFLKEREGVFELLHGLDDSSQQEVIAHLDASGDYERLFGAKPTKDEATGKYTLAVRSALPVKAPVDPQVRKDALAKDRNGRIREEVRQLFAEYKDDHTVPARRVAIAARLKQIKTLVPAAWSGSVPAQGSRATFTPQQKVSNNRAAGLQGMAKRRLSLAEASFAAREARAAAKAGANGTPLTAETISGKWGDKPVKGARGVDFTGMPAEVLTAIENTPALEVGVDGDQLKGVQVSATGKDAKGFYVDFVLPPGVGRENYRTLTRRLQNMTGITDNNRANAYFVEGKSLADGRYKTGRSVRVVFGQAKSAGVESGAKSISPKITIPKVTGAGVAHHRAPAGGSLRSAASPNVTFVKGNPANVGRNAPLGRNSVSPAPLPSPVIMKIERMK